MQAEQVAIPVQVAVAVASVLLGAVIGLICVAIFAVSLRRLSEKKPTAAITALSVLVGTVLGAGGLNYWAFHTVLTSNVASACYFIGLAVLFLPLGVLIFIDWLRFS